MLALIAGRGALPAAVAGAQEMRPLVCTLDGYAPDGLAADVTFRLETLGSLLAELHRRGITQVCLCGSIRRPEIDLSQIDDLTMPLVPVLRDALRAGDDGALRAVIGLFEAEGLEVLAAHQAAPDLLMSAGSPTKLQPPEGSEGDAYAGDLALAAMGRADLGQACVVIEGRVVLREDDAGTDAMLARLREVPPAEGGSDPFSWALDTAGDILEGAADWLSGTDGQRRGLLFKAPKPGQDRRADLPTVGPDTVAGVARAGLAGIVIEAEGVIVLDRARMLADLDRAGLFLWSREAGR
ncbi:hypothetical protein P775_15215 [Puniceibacterium antarcticum]|uniref:Phosphatidate cytidylyltransferase n=1 Tax=Puniceibacterium antarcticum TaxID=1206336 RepID=A0A2G8RD66_9RHOB|nr:UDP-2,3-diacylglucosamine diphosphatase LpxI [Puniceibacterium antarcticum]PIL19487.1 hypothetical protein P775_15215 [Puniceibacterium antarcticum]